MATIQTRASVLAVMKETTEGTPVAPAGATSFIALQDDFSMTPSFDVLENAELKSSIGASKSILGAENPAASLSHYLRSSGVVAQAPAFGPFLEASFGAVSTASTEYNTVASSTVTVIKVDTGEGATFERGEALLIKDPTNGYRIRCIDSISSDDLTIGFQLPTGMAPGTGVNLGRAVLYKPANSGHPSLTLWHYLGNAGAVQMSSGMRVTSMGISIGAGELINMNFSLEGLSFYFDPITLASSDTKLDFTDDDGTFAATIAAGVYKDPYELASAIEQAMNDTASTQVYTVTYGNIDNGYDGKFKIVGTGTVLSLLWNTGTNAANTIGDKIGFSTAADDTGTAATTGYTGDNAISWVAPYTPSYDSADPLAAKDHEVMVGTQTDYVCFKASSIDWTQDTPKTDVLSVCAASGKDGSVINSRAVTVSISALLPQHEAKKFHNYHNNDDVKFQYSFGQKSGGNWIAGKCGALYLATCSISSFEVTDADGLAQVDLELTGFVNSSGQGESFLNFL